MHTPPDPLLLLCGGLSRRMGTPKALLAYRGRTLLARLLADALPVRPVWLAAAGGRYPHTEGAEYLDDALPGREGPLSAIAAALHRAQAEGRSGVYVMACDTLLPPGRVAALLDSTRRDRPRLTVLRDAGSGRIHPLLAYWPALQADGLQGYLNGGGRQVMAWLDKSGCLHAPMPAGWRLLSNFNTPEDFERAVRAADTLFPPSDGGSDPAG